MNYMFKKLFFSYYDLVLSNRSKEKAETIIIWIAILSFLVHLFLITLVNNGFIALDEPSKLLTNPISAIYTPFSFILFFEVYLLVYFIPKSISNYIAKQYEIIALIVVRRIFKDLSYLDLESEWFLNQNDLQFTYDILSTLIIFFLIYWFHRLNSKRKSRGGNKKSLPPNVVVFIERKKVMAALLVPVILGMAAFSFYEWAMEAVKMLRLHTDDGNLIDVNNIFYDQFFTLLILTDVLLLLFSFFHTTQFHTFIRNSGFIISTILIRISFSVDGLVNDILIVVSIFFGVLVLLITEQYSKLKSDKLEV